MSAYEDWFCAVEKESLVFVSHLQLLTIDACILPCIKIDQKGLRRPPLVIGPSGNIESSCSCGTLSQAACLLMYLSEYGSTVRTCKAAIDGRKVAVTAACVQLPTLVTVTLQRIKQFSNKLFAEEENNLL